MSEFTILQFWETIEAWYAEHGAVHLLRAGATEGELLSAEAALGFRLPADLRESFLRHNGTAPHGWPYGQLLSLAQMLQKHGALAEELSDPNDDDVEYSEAEREELARLAEDVLLPIEEGSGLSLLELRVVDGVGVAADEHCVTMTGLLEDITDTLGLGNYLYVKRGDFDGLLSLTKARLLNEGVPLDDVIKMEED